MLIPGAELTLTTAIALHLADATNEIGLILAALHAVMFPPLSIQDDNALSWATSLQPVTAIVKSLSYALGLRVGLWLLPTRRVGLIIIVGMHFVVLFLLAGQGTAVVQRHH